MTWRTAALGDVCEIVSGATPRTSEEKFWGGNIFWSTPRDLSELDGAYLARPARTITEEGLKSCAASILPVNSVLLSSRAPIGLVAINSVPMATNQGFKSLVPNRRMVDSKFLFYWLKSKTSFLQGLGNGATFKEISKAVVERIEIPLPPLNEQQRIATILDKADELRRKRERSLNLLNSLIQSFFFDLFGRTDADVSRWGQAVPLSDLAEIGSGITKGRKLNGQATRLVPYLAVANVQDRRLELANVKTIEATEEEIVRYRLQKNDLLLTEGGDPDKLGRGTLWASELNEAIHQNHIFRVRLKSESVLPLFLNWLIGSPYGKKYFLSMAKQTTGIASINKKQLSEFPTVVPPIGLQHQFVKFAEKVAVESARLISSSSDTNSLLSSLQSRAFSGQL